MNVLFDHEALLQLVTNLFVLTGIRANILDLSGRDINLHSDHAPFCTRINATACGHERCTACDRQALTRYRDAKEFQFYRCHAGIIEAALPLRSSPTAPPLAYLLFGQLLDDGPMEEKWNHTRSLLSWFPGNPDSLKADFMCFRQYTRRELQAYAEILKALANHIQLKGMIITAELSDLQRLELYLDEHYMEKLSLESISRALHVGRTKLCELAKELSGGQTLSTLIASRRVQAAKALLVQSDLSIAEIGEQVGISDYNYFTKVFRNVAGTTPSAYRKQIQRSVQESVHANNGHAMLYPPSESS